MMDDKMFQELKASLKEAVAIVKGKKAPARRTIWGEDDNGKPIMLRQDVSQAPDVRLIREKLDLSQNEFARLIKVSVRTLQNWEQGSRRPTGPAEVLLELVAKAPDSVLGVLHSR